MTEAPSITDLEMIARLALAGLLGAVVGFEREWRDRSAGLRTHMLVCIGAAAFTIVSAYAFREWYTPQRSSIVMDPTRIAAQIVSGIGFLGAGAILRSGGSSVRGLTTAASLWAMAAIGMAVGAGEYVLAAASTALIVFVLTVLRQISNRIRVFHRHDQYLMQVRLANGGAFREVFDLLDRREITVLGVRSKQPAKDSDERELTLDVEFPRQQRLSELVADVTGTAGVTDVTIEEPA